MLIGLPFLWLAVFFLAPLLIVAGISLTESADAIPPFEPPIVFGAATAIESNLTAANYRQLAEGCLKIYARSLGYAASTTLLCLLIGFPMALAIARAPETWRALLLFLVVLPFWTSFLIRVYAWIALLQPSGLINRVLLAAGLIDQPMPLLYNAFSVQLGLVYSYLPFMILPLYGSLSRLDESLVEAAADLGARPWRILFGVIVPLISAGHRRRRAARLHPGGRRVRDPRPARRPGYADDRQAAVAGVFRQCRLAGGLGDRGRAGGGAEPAAAAGAAPARRRADGVSGGRGLAALRAGALALGLGFLYLPIAVLIAYSFNGSRLVTIWGGFSTRWYGALIEDEKFLGAALTSLKIGVMAASLALVLGTAAGLAMNRFSRFRGRALFAFMLTAPLVVPEVILGLSLLLLFVAGQSVLGWPAERGVLTVTIAHATFAACFVAVLVRAQLAGFDRSLEEAASDLGARPWTVLWRITLPGISPALVSGWLLAFTMSLDDLVIASFVSGPAATTLPMAVYSSVRIGVTPEINALATVFLAVVFAIVASAFVLIARQEKRRRAPASGLLAAPAARLTGG